MVKGDRVVVRPTLPIVEILTFKNGVAQMLNYKAQRSIFILFSVIVLSMLAFAASENFQPSAPNEMAALPEGAYEPEVLGACISLTATAGSPTAGYGTLKQAFDAINLGTHQGTINISVTSDCSESASAVLNASGSGAAAYTSILIQPIGARAISGNIAGHLIDLDGADNVTIDGLNSSGNSLTISNTSQQVSASTIRFINDATNNTVTNSTIAGSTGAALSSGFGVIYFATGISAGNDNNTISNNNIGAAGGNLPINCVYSFGTSAGVDNSGNSISGNNISDYFNTNSASSGINLNSNNSAWTISNNKFFQTGTRTYLTAATHNGIVVLSGTGYNINGNAIGFAAANGTGVYTMTGSVQTRFFGINLSADASVQGNTVASISLTTSGINTGAGNLCGVNVTSGNVNIGNITPNTFGATSGTDSLVAVPTGTTAAGLVGINIGGPGTVVISNNTFGAMTSAHPSAPTFPGGVVAIDVVGAAASLTITGNTIGNTTPDNIRSGTAGVTTGASFGGGIAQSVPPNVYNYSNNIIRNISTYGAGNGWVRGIQTGTTAPTTQTATINNNTITNLTTGSALSGQTSANTSAEGIQFLSGINSTISGNTISNISNTNAGAVATVVAGIVHASTTSAPASANVVSNNRIWGLSNASTTTSLTLPNVISGILIRAGSGTVTVNNNMISLGTGQTTNSSIYGIWANHGSTPDPTVDDIYFNSVDIEGTAASGAAPSAAFHRGDLSAGSPKLIPVDVRNNIFINNRSGGTGKHYAIANHINASGGSVATGWGSVNNNLLNGNASTIGYWTTDQTFAGWKSVSGGDAASFSGILVNVVNSANDLHLNMGLLPTSIESGGVSIAGFASDIDGQTRPGPAGSTNGGATAPDLGADEFDGVVAGGATPTSTSTSTSTATATATSTFTPTPPCPSIVLYDQTDTPAANGVASQDFEPANDAFDSQGADDFVIPSGQSWTVNQVVVAGSYFNGTGPVSAFNVTFYADSSGFPGTAVSTLTGATYVNNSGAFTITLPSTVTLGSGTYWVSVQARMDFSGGQGQWAWTDRTNTSNSAAVWRNPGGALSGLCPSYQRRGATCNIDAGAPDQIFQIVGGSSNGGSCATPTATATASPTPTNTNTPTPTATATSTPTPTATCEKISDTGFEAGEPWPAWTVQTSTNYDTPLCSVAGCGTGSGTAGPFAGLNWAWFGGVNPSAAETATLGQSVMFPSGGTVNLAFQMKIGGVTSPFTDTLVVTIDGTTIASFTEPAIAESAYTLRSFDVSLFANGAAHDLLFTYTSPDGASNFTVDEVSIIGCGGATPTSTNTATATATSTPSGGGSIAGTIIYGNVVAPATPPRFVKNVTVASTVGSPAVTFLTGTNGQYTLTGFGAGSYTIRPTKPSGPNSAITSADAARTAQGVVGSPAFLNQNQRFSADVNSSGSVTSNDAANIARFAAGLSANPGTFVGNWKFFVTGAPSPLPTPPQTYNDSRSYASVSGALTGEDYIGLLLGEVSGNYNTGTNPRPVRSVDETAAEGDFAEPGRSITAQLPTMTADSGKEIVVPVNVAGVADKDITSYQFDLRYDPSVIQPVGDIADVKETASRGLSVVVNPNEPGLLRVVVYGVYPIDTDGVLLNLRFTAVGEFGSVTPISFEQVMFNEGEPKVDIANGQVQLF